MPMTPDEIARLLASRTWFHRYELAEGVVTPGLYNVDARAWIDRTLPGEDIAGLRVLEIGTWDGPYAFALESRGAIVDATDIQDPDETGFNVAKRILGSRVTYTRTSVYDVGAHFPPGSFDCILFLGVFYHLQHPVRAFEALARLLKPGGRMFFEGECLINYAETADGTRAGWLDRLALRRLARSPYPVALYYAGRFKDDASNWHVPNVACVVEWMKTAGLQVSAYACVAEAAGDARFPVQRISGRAIRAGAPVPEHPMVEEIATDLQRVALELAKRRRRLTPRKVAARAMSAVLSPFGLRREGYRIARMAKP